MAVEPTSTPDSSSAAPMRVLVVDDNIPSAKTTGWTLEMLGLEVQTVYDGEQALEHLRHRLPDMVVLDIGLPGIDGYEVARRLRADPRYAGLIIIAQTGWAEQEHRTRTREAGFDYHLVKPVEVSSLEKILSEVRKDRGKKRPAA